MLNIGNESYAYRMVGPDTIGENVYKFKSVYTYI